MVKSYDRYEFEDCFGIVNSRSSNCIFFNTNHILTGKNKKLLSKFIIFVFFHLNHLISFFLFLIIGHDEEVSLWNIQEKEIKKK